MKYLVRSFVFNVFGLWLTSQVFPALSLAGTWVQMMAAGLVLSLLMLIVKPALKILFIPINILTFGLLAWVINVIVIYLLTILVADVSVTAWTFPGLHFAGFIVPSLHLTYIMSLVLVSLSVTAIVNFLHNVSE